MGELNFRVYSLCCTGVPCSSFLLAFLAAFLGATGSSSLAFFDVFFLVSVPAPSDDLVVEPPAFLAKVARGSRKRLTPPAKLYGYIMLIWVFTIKSPGCAATALRV
jgi:hypothetical protein